MKLYTCLPTLQALAASSSGAPYLTPDVQTERRPQRRECAQSDTPYIPGIELYYTHMTIIMLLRGFKFWVWLYTLPSLSFSSSFKLLPISNVLSIALKLRTIIYFTDVHASCCFTVICRCQMTITLLISL